MRARGVRAGLLVWTLSAIWAVGAVAQPGTGPRETIDQPFTTTKPNSPTGMSFTGVYHAAGNARANPPYMRRMVFYPPRGMRYDTTVPARCTAPDVVLQVMGPDGCPAGSRIGGGTTEGIFYEPIAHSFVFDRFKHTLDVMNNANEQVILVKAEGYAVVRGRMRPDGSIEFASPTCFPVPPTGHCVDDYVLQTKSSTFFPVYKRASGGRVRSYATTPPKCPAGGYWKTTVRFWWANGAVDTVASKEPCRRPRGGRRP